MPQKNAVMRVQIQAKASMMKGSHGWGKMLQTKGRWKKNGKNFQPFIAFPTTNNFAT
jgi:hypothetical protein